MNNAKIGTVQAILIILLSLVAHTVLSLPKTLIENSKTAVILNVVYVTVLALLFVYVVYRLFRKFPRNGYY